MKLIKKTQRFYLWLTVVLLLLWSILFLYGISWAIRENIDETLHSELLTIVHEPTQNMVQPVSTQLLKITPIAEVRDTGIVFSDTTLYNSIEEEPYPYRQVQTEASIGNKNYQIILRRSLVEYDDLFEAILVMEFIFVLLLLGGLFLLNKKILERLWQPFYNTLNQVTSYKIGQGDKLQWQETKIDEFQRLNHVLRNMIRQIEQEYESLKQFTENASHEIQTPLAVISNKTEILMQDESLTQEQGKRISDIHQTAGKLSRLNKALLMLTKIENRHYHQKEEVNTSRLLTHLIPDYQAMAQAKNIRFEQEIEAGVHVNMNPELAELMFRNLLGNAVKHNYTGGKIKIELAHRYFLINNTGTTFTEDPQKYFKRFNKGERSTESLGLGLSIVLAIAETNNFDLIYRMKNEMHEIELQFKKHIGERSDI